MRAFHLVLLAAGLLSAAGSGVAWPSGFWPGASYRNFFGFGPTVEDDAVRPLSHAVRKPQPQPQPEIEQRQAASMPNIQIQPFSRVSTSGNRRPMMMMEDIYGLNGEKVEVTKPEVKVNTKVRSKAKLKASPVPENFGSLFNKKSSSKEEKDGDRDMKSLKFVDWFEAAGREATCEVPPGLLDESILDRTGDGGLEGDDKNDIHTRKSRISVCKNANPGDEKCVCVRKPFSRKDYRLQCGTCQDPCALEFAPEPMDSGTETAEAGVTLNRLTSPKVKVTVSKTSGTTADEEMDVKKMSTEDLKKLLLESFFDEITMGNQG